MAINTTGTSDAAQGLNIKARSQREIVLGRFLRHRGALAGMIMFALVLVLAVSSIGVRELGIPGWWHHAYDATGSLVDNGRPTLSIIPTWLGGDGLHMGDHPFGQTQTGKDYFAATMRGAQISILVALLLGLAGTIIGVIIGAIAGYFRGRLDAVLMRFTDVVLVIPFLLMAAMLGRIVYDTGNPVGSFVVESGLQIPALAVALSLVTWPATARLVRGEVLSIREMEFVEAARAAGTRSGRIIFRHVLPNAQGTIIVATTLAIAVGILLETALSFLGFGVKSPDTSLGLLVTENQTALLGRPWLFWWPGLFIVTIALAINFIGDGLRDAFDPRQTRVRE